MSNIALITAAAAITFTASPAFAGDMSVKAEAPQPEAKVERTYVTQAGTMASETRTEVEAEVRSAVARGDMVLVEGPDGQTYVNKFVSTSELPDPTLDVRTVDTYTYEYRGMTFTNRVVAED